MPVDLPNPARASVRPLSDPIPVPPPAELTGPWTPQTLASAGDSTGANRPLIPLAPGQTPHVPGYELLGILGRGGMGVVYRARQTKLNRIVALKMILGDRSDPKDLIRFLAEAEAVAAVRHPHVVQVYEYGDAEGQPFLALEYLPGGSLADHLKFRGRMVPEAAAEVVRKLAIGIQAVHDHGIVHRDLKPANVLFDESGEPKVADFGLAKRDDHHDLTARDAVMGTPAFMAPEQAAGGTKFVGPAADIYSLGVILYVCLTGKRPFEDTDALSLLRKVIDVEPDRPRKHVPMLPRDLELICLKCLAKVPHERYLTAKALADDLSNFSGGRPVSVRPAGVVERGVKWARRKPVVAAAYGLTAVSLLLAGLVVGAVWLWQSAERARDGEMAARGIAELEQKAATDARGIAELARDGEKDARKNEEKERKKADDLANRLEVFEYGKTMQVAHQEWREGNVAATLALLDATPKHLRGWEWQYVNRLCHSDLLTLDDRSGLVLSVSYCPTREWIVTASLNKVATIWDARTGAVVRRLLGHTDRVESASFSADGTQVVTASGDRTAIVWNSETGTKLFTLKGHTNSLSAASFSADGTRVVTGSADMTAKIWNARTGAELLTLKGHSSNILSASFNSNGDRVLTAGSDDTGRIWDARTGVELVRLKGHSALVWSASFSSDGLRVVTGSWDKTAKVWDAKTGTELLTLKGHSDKVTGSSFSTDGLRVVTGSWDATAKVWDAKSGAELLTLKGHADGVSSAVFSPNGSRLVTGSFDETAKVWDAQWEPEALTLKGHTNWVSSASFSADGSRIVTGGSKTATVWDAKTGSEFLTLKGHTNSVNSASFSADGSRIMTGCADKTAKVWDAKTGTELLTLKGHTNSVYSASFSADGSRIVTGSHDKTAKVWDAKTGALILTLKGHTDGVHSVGFSADNSRILTAGRQDKTAKVWDAKTGAEALTLIGHTRSVDSAAFSPDGLRVVTGSQDRTAKVWDAKTGAELLTLKGHTDTVSSASFSADGSRIVTGSNDDTAKIWDARPVLREVPPTVVTMPPKPATPKSETPEKPLQLVAHSGPVLALGFNSEGSRLVTGDSSHVRVWDVSSGMELTQLVVAAPVTRAWFDASGRILTACNSEGVTRLHTADGKPLGFLKPNEGGLLREALFTPDGNRVVTTHNTGVLTVFDAEKQKIIKSIAAFDAKQVQNGMAISPDGKRVCSAVGKGTEWNVKVWDLETEKEVQSWAASEKPVWGVAWSADGKWIVSCGVDQTVKVWHADTGKLHKTLTGSDRTVSRVAINRDNNRIVASCFDGIVRVWDLAKGQVVKTFDLGAAGNGNVAFSPDGKRLAASAPGVVRIFDLPE